MRLVHFFPTNPASLLIGDLSEDPKFPKVQWPTPDVCPACHEEIKGLHSWNKIEVLKFLKQHYGSDNILYTYAEDQTELEERERLEEKQRTKKPSRENKDKVPNLEKQLDSQSRILERLKAKEDPVRDRGQKPGGASAREEETKRGVSFLGIGFSNLDMSLCIVLYVASSLFLMIMYFFFRMRSKRWKVKYNRPYV